MRLNWLIFFLVTKKLSSCLVVSSQFCIWWFYFCLSSSQSSLLFVPCHTQAFSQAYSTQRKVAEDSETNEEALLQESATKEAYYISRLLNQQTELKHTRSQASNTQLENERLSIILQELREVRPWASHLQPRFSVLYCLCSSAIFWYIF